MCWCCVFGFACLVERVCVGLFGCVCLVLVGVVPCAWVCLCGSVCVVVECLFLNVWCCLFGVVCLAVFVWC